MGGQKNWMSTAAGEECRHQLFFLTSSVGNIGGGLGIVSEKSKTVSSRYLDGKMPCGY